MIRRLAQTAALMLLGLTPTLARAQEAAPGGASEPGDPTYSYIGAGLLAAGIIFLICKSARRSP